MIGRSADTKGRGLIGQTSNNILKVPGKERNEGKRLFVSRRGHQRASPRGQQSHGPFTARIWERVDSRIAKLDSLLGFAMLDQLHTAIDGGFGECRSRITMFTSVEHITQCVCANYSVIHG
jgi:hypothetical protein